MLKEELKRIREQISALSSFLEKCDDEELTTECIDASINMKELESEYIELIEENIKEVEKLKGDYIEYYNILKEYN